MSPAQLRPFARPPLRISPYFATPLNPEQEATLDLKEIRQIIEMMKRHDLSFFHLEREGFKIKLRKGVDFDAMAPKFGPAAPAPPLPSQSPHNDHASDSSESPAPESPAPSGGAKILSPMVGTFYRAAGPGEKIFANVGDTVTEDTTVCIIEAMKVMNEIKAESSGIITRILVDDATPVQFETPLFEIKPA